MGRTYTNIISNPSFETGVTGWVADRTTIAQSSVFAYAGNTGCAATVTSTGTVIGVKTVNLTIPTGTFVMSYYIYHESGSNRTAYFRFGGINDMATLVPSGVITRVVRVRTSGASVSDAVLTVPDAQVGDVLHFDAILVCGVADTGDIPSYFDGDTPGAVWSGTPHASTSTLTIPDAVASPIIRIGTSYIGPLRVGKV